MMVKRVFVAVMAVTVVAGILSISYYATVPHYVPPKLIVVDGNGNYLVEGNFSDWYGYNSPIYYFYSNATLLQSHYQDSQFNMEIRTYSYNYTFAPNGPNFHIGVALLLTGHLAPNIDPNSLVIVANDTGFQTSNVIQLHFNPFSWGNNTNASYHLQNIHVGIAGTGSISVPVGLANQTIVSKWHNFAFYADFQIMVWPNTNFGVHHFHFLANLKGLGIPVYVCANMVYLQQ